MQIPGPLHAWGEGPKNLHFQQAPWEFLCTPKPLLLRVGV